MKKKSSHKKSFSVGEAAKKLKVSRQAIYKAIERGALKAEKKEVVSIELRIPAEALHSFRISELHQSVGQKK